MKIAMIMLAAGNSRRFGANKLLYEIDGIPMYRHVLEQLDDTKKKIENIYSEYSDITEDNNSDIVQLNNLYRNNTTAKIICNIIVITQYDAIAEAVKTKEIQVLYNPHPEDGISSSVKIGLNASLDADAVLFTVSDQPWLTSETICELIHVFLNTSKGIACVSCQGKMGNPCIFDRKYYNELLSLEGDKGGKKKICYRHEPPYQTRSVANFAQTVRQSAHNADFFRLRISKMPANAHEMNYFYTLCVGSGKV